jgi:hypothetical protein
MQIFRLPKRPIVNVGVNFETPEETKRQSLSNLALEEGIQTSDLQQRSLQGQIGEFERRRSLNELSETIMKNPNLNDDEKARQLTVVSQAIDPQGYLKSVQDRTTTLANLASRFWQATTGKQGVKIYDDKIVEWKKTMEEAKGYIPYGETSAIPKLAAIAGVTEGITGINASKQAAAGNRTDFDKIENAMNRINRVINSAASNQDITQEEKDKLTDLDVITSEKLKIARKYAGEDVKKEVSQLQADFLIIGGTGAGKRTQTEADLQTRAVRQANLAARVINLYKLPEATGRALALWFTSESALEEMQGTTEDAIKRENITIDVTDEKGKLQKYDSSKLISLFSNTDSKNNTIKQQILAKLKTDGKEQEIKLLGRLEAVYTQDIDKYILNSDYLKAPKTPETKNLWDTIKSAMVPQRNEDQTRAKENARIRATADSTRLNLEMFERK